jgi:hypothetical protein
LTTIAEVAEEVLKEKKVALTLEDIYSSIKFKNLYTFKENVNEIHILRTQIERKCINSNFSYTTEKKVFVRGQNNAYSLIEWYTEEGLKELFEEEEFNLKDLKDEIRILTKEHNNLKDSLDKLGNIEKIIEDVKIQELNSKSKLDLFDKESKEKLVQFDTNKESYINQINEYKKDIREILEKVTSYELSNLYSNKVDQLSKKAARYHFGFIFLLLISFLTGFYLFIGYSYSIFNTPTDIIKILNSENSWVKIGSKFILIFPIIISATFYWNRYNRTNRLLEEYDYKTMLSKTFINNFNIIVEQTKADTNDAHIKSIHLALERLLETPSLDTKKETPKTVDLNLFKDLFELFNKGKN